MAVSRTETARMSQRAASRLSNPPQYPQGLGGIAQSNFERLTWHKKFRLWVSFGENLPQHNLAGFFRGWGPSRQSRRARASPRRITPRVSRRTRRFVSPTMRRAASSPAGDLRAGVPPSPPRWHAGLHSPRWGAVATTARRPPARRRRRMRSPLQIRGYRRGPGSTTTWAAPRSSCRRLPGGSAALRGAWWPRRSSRTRWAAGPRTPARRTGAPAVRTCARTRCAAAVPRTTT